MGSLMMRTRPILLVEDNPDDRELTIRAFRKVGVVNELVTVADGEEALQYLMGRGQWAGKEPELPEVVLLDLKLPKVDGMEVLREVRSSGRTKSLPVVILTSSSEEDDVARGYELGANSFVRKPVDFGEFVRVAGQLGLYWLLLNEPPPVRCGA